MGIGTWLRKLMRTVSGGRQTFIESGLAGTGTDTEFSAEVVRVTEIIPHSNAEKLEIARFEMASSGPSSYDVVVQKGVFAPGSLAAYLSVDSIVPIDHPSGEFKFLGERIDGKGKTHFRIRAARLRGVFSQGLFAKVPASYEFGDKVIEAYSVSYYSPPEKGLPTQPGKAGKARTQPAPIYGVDSLKKLPRLFADGEPVLVTEKIHGTNFRFGWVPRRILGMRIGWQFFVGSHRMAKDTGKGGGFYGEDLWADSAVSLDLKRLTAGHKGKVFFGELYGRTLTGQKIQDLTYGVQGPHLAVFDIWDHRKGYLPAETRVDILGDIPLPSVPVLALGNYTPELLALAEGKSTLDPATVREGVVIETWSGQRKKAKYVSQGYLMRKEAA